MIEHKEIIKLIFAFKVKYLRQAHNLSFQELSEKTGLSISYLHDIEKGKKYPKVDKISSLANAFEVSYDFMVSMSASKKLQPIIDILQSDFFKVFPLELFGMNAYKLFELFSNTPDKVNAFISTIVTITRNYQMRSEHFYFAALRSYQDMHDNYFEALEQATENFRQKNGKTSSVKDLEAALAHYNITVDRQQLAKLDLPSQHRSYFSKQKQVLFLNKGLSPAQERFLLGRELAFQYLEIKDRPYIMRITNIESFEHLLNNFKASYFSVALLMDEKELIKDLQTFGQASEWQPQSLIELVEKYDVTPEMFLQRLTNILPHHFGIKDLFFIRLATDDSLQHFHMTKELHLSRMHSPYANLTNEHYCRKWVSVSILKNLRASTSKTKWIADAQISSYWETDNHYLCLSFAKKDPYEPQKNSSVTIGLMINEQVKHNFHFLRHPKFKIRTVNTTCERCSMTDCEARAAAPITLERINAVEDVNQIVKKLDN